MLIFHSHQCVIQDDGKWWDRTCSDIEYSICEIVGGGSGGSGLYLEINALKVAMEESIEETRGKRKHHCRNPPIHNKFSGFFYSNY